MLRPSRSRRTTRRSRTRPICRDFVAILRTGRPRNWAGAAQGEWVEAMKKPEFARQFTAAMDCRGVYLGRGVARNATFATRHRLLDIAGGSGVYACCIVEEHPHLRATVLERPPVDEVARRAIARPRLQRPRVGPGCGYACRPAAGQASTLTSFRTSCTTGTCRSSRQLLAASAAALPPAACSSFTTRTSMTRRPARSRSPLTRAC